MAKRFDGIIAEEIRPTTDEWYPCCKGHTVRVKFAEVPGQKKRCWVICAWGDDDFGYEIFLEDKTEAKKIWDSIPQVVTHESLEKLGLRRA